jgi:8-oxo-dGTP diphosphatase
MGSTKTTSQRVASSDIHGNQYEVDVNELRWRPAAYGIVIRDNAILLTKQHGVLHLPGGGVEFGEMPEDGVIREIHEETGIIVAEPQLVHQISGFFTFATSQGPQHVQSILLYYRCEAVGGELSTDGFEDDEKLMGELAEWVPLAELDRIEVGSTIDWRSVVRKEMTQ